MKIHPHYVPLTNMDYNFAILELCEHIYFTAVSYALQSRMGKMNVPKLHNKYGILMFLLNLIMKAKIIRKDIFNAKVYAQLHNINNFLFTNKGNEIFIIIKILSFVSFTFFQATLPVCLPGVTGQGDIRCLLYKIYLKHSTTLQ